VLNDGVGEARRRASGSVLGGGAAGGGAGGDTQAWHRMPPQVVLRLLKNDGINK
jgi:hypothetical protein